MYESIEISSSFFQGDKYRLKNDHSHPAPLRRQVDDAKKVGDNRTSSCVVVYLWLSADNLHVY